MKKERRILAVLVGVAAVMLLITLVKSPGFAEDAPKKAAEPKSAEVDVVTTATGKPWESGEDLGKAIEFIQKHRMGFLATVDNGKPRVRAWGLMKYDEGKLYFGTANTKDAFTQLKDVPYAEYISMDPETYTTLRVFGEVVFVEDSEIKQQIMDENPMIKDMYAGDKEKEFEVFYLHNIQANWFGFTMPPKEEQEEGE